MNRAEFLMMSLEDVCLEAFDSVVGGGSRENLAAMKVIGRLCPLGPRGIWVTSGELASAARHVAVGAPSVPNRATEVVETDDFVPNRTNEWGDPIFSPKAADSVGLSHLIPVYAATSRVCHIG